MQAFQPDYRNFLAVLNNQRPARLPIYEHQVNNGSIENITGRKLPDTYSATSADDLADFAREYCAFWKDLTYDTVTFESCIGMFLPDSGAIMGGRPGPIQTRADFDAYPWDEVPVRFWAWTAPRLDALRTALPPGMKLLGGVGNGVFEISENLTGLEYLPFMESDDPGLYADLHNKIGWLMVTIWTEFLARYADIFVGCRFGDDLGFRTSTLTHPTTIRNHIVPQYRKVIDLVHAAGKKFLYHSCGNIFEVMDDIIDAGIDAKHSNEDPIAPFQKWIDDYGPRIGLCGGFDLDFICCKSEQEVYESALELGRQYRRTARGYALGSGNSIPEYVPTANYLAMIRAAQTIREEEER
jgi:uroporphyrinogen decarboxylase